MRILTVLALSIAGQAGAQDVAEGSRLFQLHCASCHGIEAEGDGPMAPVLLVQPSDLTSMTDRYDGRFPVERIVSRIDGRDPLVSHGSDMPVYGWFFEGPPARLRTPGGGTVATTQDIADIVRWLQTIQRD